MNRIDLENDYKKSLEFWNTALKNDNIVPINETWISDKKVLQIFKKYIANNSRVLDYACGSGWALFEIALRNEISEGIGVDTSSNAIESNSKIADISGLKNIKFLCGNQTVLSSYLNYFDFAISINLFDVIPDETIIDILDKLSKSIKDNSYFFVGLNPDFTKDELTNLLKMENKGNYYYKNDILRCNKKSVEEWKMLFSKYFNVIETFKFALTTQEERYSRIGFLLKKK